MLLCLVQKYETECATLNAQLALCLQTCLSLSVHPAQLLLAQEVAPSAAEETRSMTGGLFVSGHVWCSYTICPAFSNLSQWPCGSNTHIVREALGAFWGLSGLVHALS